MMARGHEPVENDKKFRTHWTMATHGKSIDGSGTSSLRV